MFTAGKESHGKLMIPSFKNVLYASIALRVALILYSEWHDARSIVKYTDVDYRVFTDAARFILQPSAANRARGPILNQLALGELVPDFTANRPLATF